MTYRPEIDGLRAIAVLAVILAHANFSVFGGGFIGVDVFFVISGYLITTIILDEYAKGQFSLIRFYERRARRILPALFFMLLCTMPFAWMWLLPDAYERFSKSLVMATLSVSNIYFLKKTDYFAPDALQEPLLHTWSLGVEEQFYLLFPLLFLFRLKSRTILCVVAVAALASFLMSEFGSPHFPSANYYLLPTRAWEILAGSLCAFFLSGGQRPINSAASIFALAAIVLSVFWFDAGTRIPSFAALLPVGGTVLLLIFATAQTGAGRLLSSTPLVWIGRVSFSAYLLHQPVFAFWRVRNLEEPSTFMMCALIVLTLALAGLSWRFVEQPFRHAKMSLRQVATSVMAGCLILTGISFYVIAKDGVAERLPADVTAFIERSGWSKKCLFQVEDGEQNPPEKECMFDMGVGRNYAIWGDSIGSSIAPALLERLKSQGGGLVQMTHGFCAPILNVSAARNEVASNCDGFNKRAFEYLITSNVDTVILTAAWVNFLNSGYMTIDGEEFSGAGIRVSEITRHLQATITQLQKSGKRVIILFPAPHFNIEVRDEMASRLFKGDLTPDFEYSHADFKTNTARAYSVLEPLETDDVRVVSPEAIFCGTPGTNPCFFGRDGVAYIADRGHYTYQGASMIADAIMREINRMPSETPTALNAR